MRLNTVPRIAICSTLCLLAGCCKKPVPITSISDVAPSLGYVSGYADVGAIIQWNPGSQPFQVYFQDDVKPCDPSDSLQSDGTKSVICHVKTAGSYRYMIGPLALKKFTTGGGVTVFSQHVGSCNGCTKIETPTGAPTKTGKNAQTDQNPPPIKATEDIFLKCGGKPSDPGTADPSTQPAAQGDTVYWDFQGTYPSGTPVDIFDVTIPAGICLNSVGPTVITSTTQSCTLTATVGNVPYSFTVYGCTTTAGTGYINVSAPQ